MHNEILKSVRTPLDKAIHDIDSILIMNKTHVIDKLTAETRTLRRLAIAGWAIVGISVAVGVFIFL